MRKLLEKSVSILFSLLIFGWLAIGVHEQIHALTANAVGLPGGTVTFFGGGGFYNWPVGVPITPTQDWIVGLSGGIGTGLLFLLLWWIAHSQLQYTDWELDDTFALLTVALIQFTYAPFDAFARLEAGPGAILAAVIGLAFSVFIYGSQIWSWLNED